MIGSHGSEKGRPLQDICDSRTQTLVQINCIEEWVQYSEVRSGWVCDSDCVAGKGGEEPGYILRYLHDCKEIKHL